MDADAKHAAYEVTYNTATALLAQGEINQAIELLEVARSKYFVLKIIITMMMIMMKIKSV